MRRAGTTVLLTLAATLALGACAAPSDDADAEPGAGAAPGTTAAGDGATGATDAFPVTIEHAFGETVIDAEPLRVVTWGWGSADAALAIGVVPVAIPFQGYGGDSGGVLPWVADRLAELGAQTPTILPDSAEAPIEAIAAAEPDLILAHYSGLTAEEYDLLSAIAPTVAYPDQAWSTPWREVIETTGRALGRSAAAADVLDGIDDAVASAAAEHPEFAGVSVAQVWDTGDTFYVYSPADPRVEFTEDLGFVTAPSVTELSTGESTFYFTLSHEQLDRLSSDLLIAYADDRSSLDAFLASAPAQAMPQVTEGAVAGVVGQSFVASVSPPTALSLTWGLADYVDLLAEAVDGIS
jgi:iron complex transport system substrate-binding protein